MRQGPPPAATGDRSVPPFDYDTGPRRCQWWRVGGRYGGVSGRASGASGYLFPTRRLAPRASCEEMGSRRTLGLFAIILGTAATSATAAAPRSGLYGVVTRGPITPVCRVGVPCDAPAGKVTLTFSRAGLAKTTQTDQLGGYRIALAPGTYAVRTSSKPFGQTPRPANVHVRAGHVDKIDFAIDTGIR
jgi:hypothetical protein